ncbi:MAG TPA: peptide ABC transporter substrate-binding protein [Ktedonobacteraceae bacterium]
MCDQFFLRDVRRVFPIALLLCALLLLLAACGGSTPNPIGITPAARQVLTFPNVGTSDISVLDPAEGADSNSALAVDMLYSGLVRFDEHLNVSADQATWTISPDRKTYTFTLKPGITFSDGTPLTARTYVYTLTRALAPGTRSPIATLFLGNILGAAAYNSGKASSLSGVQALDDTTLQITLSRPTEYFLQVMASSVAFALNPQVIGRYGPGDWTNHVVGSGVGTGPFLVRTWDRQAKMVLAPNPHYYGKKTRLSEVDMIFVNDPATAFKSYEAHQFDFAWNIAPPDLPVARKLAGYTSQSLLETDMLFFDNTRPPFTNQAVRQAFASAINKSLLVKAIFNNSVVAAPTIIPPGMPGYQPGYPGLPFDVARARALFQSVYPDASKTPDITFTYPGSQVSSSLAQALQQMWQTALGVQVHLQSMDLTAYNNATAVHQVQFGFTQWGADFPDPYDWLALNLLSTAPNNNGQWHNVQFDQTIARAEDTSGQQRIALYNQAEQIAISSVGWLPLDHQAMSALIPSYMHGVSLSNTGLYFGDWSDVYLLQH